jgi:hypothetical protein
VMWAGTPAEADESKRRRHCPTSGSTPSTVASKAVWPIR